MNKQKILCPVDYSSSSVPAVNLATKLAAADKSKVYLLHVNVPKDTMSMDEAQVSRFRERIADQALEHHGVEFEHINLRGKPAEVIVNFAKKQAIDLIVMGTHGRTGLARVVAGSVAKNVMADAPCPVVMVKVPESKNRFNNSLLDIPH